MSLWIADLPKDRWLLDLRKRFSTVSKSNTVCLETMTINFRERADEGFRSGDNEYKRAAMKLHLKPRKMFKRKHYSFA